MGHETAMQPQAGSSLLCTTKKCPQFDCEAVIYIPLFGYTTGIFLEDCRVARGSFSECLISAHTCQNTREEKENSLFSFSTYLRDKSSCFEIMQQA